MSKQWYLSLDGRQLGPLPSEQVQRMAERGQIKPETLLRPETQEEWLPAQTWPQLFASGGTSPASPSAPVKRVVPKAKAIADTPAPVVKPAAGTIPRGAAVGTAVVPVGAPVTPANIPVGTPVGAALAAPLAAPISALGPVIVTDAPASRFNAGEGDEPGARKKKNRTPVMVLGGAAVLVALAGGLLVAFNPFLGGEEKPVTQAATPLAVAAKGPEANPETMSEVEPPAEVAAPTKASAKAEGESATPEETASNKFAKELQRQVRNWNSAAAAYQIRSVVGYRVSSVWLEKGSDGKPLIFVQVALTNLGQAPLVYRGWNGLAAKENSAVLLDDEGAALALAPAKESAADRLKSVSVPPKESVTDTLVFAAPAGEIEKLRLMMPHATISGLRSGVFALEIPAAMVSKERPAASAASPGEGLLAGKAGATSRQESELERERRKLAESLGGTRKGRRTNPSQTSRSRK
jgi:hypothetical protein